MVSTYKSVFSELGTKVYTDLDFSLKANPFNGDIRKKSNADAIKQSFKNLLFLKNGEKPFDRKVGGGLEDLLFEPLDAITTIQLQQAILTTIQNGEPRVLILDIQLSDTEDQALDITIKYTMRNVFEPTSVNFIMYRSR